LSAAGSAAVIVGGSRSYTLKAAAASLLSLIIFED
jgi:hypothetical protein